MATTSQVAAGSLDPESLAGYLAAHRSFGVLPAHELHSLASEGTLRTYAKGQNLFYEGDAAGQVFDLRSGLVALADPGLEGNPHVMLTFVPGDLLGLGATILGQSWPGTATAMLDTDAFIVTKGTFDRLYHQYPEFAQRVLGEIVMLVRRSRQIAARRAATSVISRTASFLLDFGTGDLNAGAAPTGCRLDLTHRELALLLGTSRETITRVLARLARAGLVVTESRHVRVLDPDRLRRLIDS